jgi:hypothetical protein
MADKVKKGRHPRSSVNAGSTHGMSALTEEQVLRIRAMRASGAMVKHLSQQFGVSEGAISAICNRKSWRHI